ncbi:PHP-associated domain-containing protein [Wukongibacter sp. M2B1]|uniref:PHP-associated domain-containing protein n=1 Tax=Wukongibacter sp. M2B1 TaxID=3088895 RepID=UPI003D7BF512
MIIDLHFHTIQYSPCSYIDMEEGIRYAKDIGLDGICITDHDNNEAKGYVKELEKKYRLLVIAGVEIFTYEGDILCFGIDKLPEKRLHAQELIDFVNEKGGATISAHPFRNNGRGLGNKIKDLNGLSAIEIFNGNTSDENNLKAHKLASRLNIPCVGASDTHKLQNIGKYATRFHNKIKGEKDLIEAIKHGKVVPVYYDDYSKKFNEF